MEVKWIKLTTDMFDNRKIRYLRSLPEGNNIVLIWVMLLTMAGRCNAGGMIFLTENISYTPKILADELGFDANVVTVALNALSSLGMITANEERFCITNWNEYQSAEGLEKIREQNRQRKAKQREREKALPESRDSHVTVTDSSISLSISKSNKSSNRNKAFIPPTLDEIKAYCAERGNGIDPQHFYDYQVSRGWVLSNGKKMADWKATVRTWEQREKKDKAQIKKKGFREG